MASSNLQLDAQGGLRHLLSIDELPREVLVEILDRAKAFAPAEGQQAVKKVPLLRGKTIVNLFFEPSTRTLMTFELAGMRLSADVLNLDVSRSSTAKGESLLDTLRNIEAMHADMFVIRHSASGAAHFFAQHAAPNISVINAGDGNHSHPTQALLDMFTIRRHKGDFSNLTVTIVGDILHSRVARSQIHALRILGVPDIRVVAPATLLPTGIEAMGAKAYSDLGRGLDGADVVIMLRLQHERMSGSLLPSPNEYFEQYGLTDQRLRQTESDAIVMHPGPINRGVEIESAVADGSRSVVLEQVSNGLAVRMAAMTMCLSHSSGSSPGSSTSAEGAA